MGNSCLNTCITISEEETKKLELGCYNIEKIDIIRKEENDSDYSPICDLSLPSVSDTESRWSLKMTTAK